jgi:glyoxylase-like metal-dependent hydrolase (beta-lactamase superfamily II)
MRVTEHIHAIKIPFKLSVEPGSAVNRFVYTYLILGREICLIDCGVSSAVNMIFDYVRKVGRDPREISLLVLTHSHPDHIGGARDVARECGCQLAAHVDAQPWIEDVELQFRERPIVNFHSLVAGPMKIDVAFRDGDELDLGDGRVLGVLHTPGHSRGSVSLVFREDGALFTGDAVPMAGGLPIYEDVLSSIRSIRKLAEIGGLRVLFASWEDPHHGERVYELMEEALHYFQHTHAAVRRVTASSPSLDSRELCSRVLKELGLPEAATPAIVVKSIEAHLRELRHEDIVAG